MAAPLNRGGCPAALNEAGSTFIVDCSGGEPSTMSHTFVDQRSLYEIDLSCTESFGLAARCIYERAIWQTSYLIYI
jgi:hypothetical protein